MSQEKKKIKRSEDLLNLIDDSLDKSVEDINKEQSQILKSDFNRCPTCNQVYQWDSFLRKYMCECDVIIM